jgi:FkbM family methyltransferase
VAGQLFHRFLEDGGELDVAGSDDFHPVGPGIIEWRRPAAAELTEWRAVFDAIEDASARLTMLEIGAGFGRWTVNAAAALRAYRPELKHRFVAVEAEPTHYRWLEQHTRANGLRRWSRAGSCKLIRAAVSSHTGQDKFFFGNPEDWYGQVLVRPENEGADAPVTRVRTVTLSSLLQPLGCIDLIDLDIQGTELEVLTEAAHALGKVRRIHVETHSDQIDEQLPAVLEQAAGHWEQEIAIPLGTRCPTVLGEADFAEGGVQLWRNNHR